MTRRRILVAATAVMWVALAATPILRVASSHPVHASPPGITGSWVLTIQPQGGPRIREIHTDTADGSVIDAASAQMTDTPETENGTSGEGSWVTVGGKRYRERIISLLTDTHRHFVGTFMVRTTITVSGDALTGTAIWKALDKNGRQQHQGTSTFTGQRIKA